MSGQPKYILTERIAQGGMAEIHLGKSVGLDGFARVCAFKRILAHYSQDNEFIQMFRNEAMVAKQLQNKNIVQVFDFVGDGQSHMLVMEFVDGQDLRSVLMVAEQSKKRVPIELACYICIEALSGLHYAHSAVDVNGVGMGIIHRDVSPQNVLLSYEGDVKITDFGIAKAQNQTSTTRAGVLKGKFRYMSPEQAKGENIDARSDIFALGVILYEMLTMQRLFKGEDMAVLEAVRQCKIKSPSAAGATHVPPELDAIVLKLLSGELDKRYQNGKEAIKDLSKFLYKFRPDFFAGELSEYMHLLFADKITSARERLRSTLALPVGAMGPGGFQDVLGRGMYNDHHSSVMDLSQHGAQERAAVQQQNQINVEPLRQQVVAAHANQVKASMAVNGSGVAMGQGNNAVRKAKQALDQNAKPAKIELAGGARAPYNSEAHKSQKANYKKGVKVVSQTHNSTTYGRSTVGHKRKANKGHWRLVGLTTLAISLFLGGVVYLKSNPALFPTTYEVNAMPSGKVVVELNGLKLLNGIPQALPVKLNLEAGNHQVTLMRPGFRTKKIKVNAGVFGGVIKESVVFEKTGPLGQIRITTSPAGARIILDASGDELKTPATFEFVPIGKPVSFKITHPKCSPAMFRETLSISAEHSLVVRNINLKNCR